MFMLISSTSAFTCELLNSGKNCKGYSSALNKQNARMLLKHAFLFFLAQLWCYLLCDVIVRTELVPGDFRSRRHCRKFVSITLQAKSICIIIEVSLARSLEPFIREGKPARVKKWNNGKTNRTANLWSHFFLFLILLSFLYEEEYRHEMKVVLLFQAVVFNWTVDRFWEDFLVFVTGRPSNR